MSYQHEKAAYALIEAIDAFYKNCYPFDREFTKYEFAQEEASMREGVQTIMYEDGFEYLQGITNDLSEIIFAADNDPTTASAAKDMINKIREYMDTDWSEPHREPAPHSVFALTAIGQLPTKLLHCEVFEKYIDAKYAMNMEYRKRIFACLERNSNANLSACVSETLQASFIIPDPSQGILWTITPCLLQDVETLSVFQKYKESLTDVLVEGSEYPVKSTAVACPAGGSLVSANYNDRQGLLWYTLEEWPIGISLVSTASVEWCTAHNEINNIDLEDAENRVKAELGITVNFMKLNSEDDNQ